MTAVLDHTENAFESLIVSEMTAADSGWLPGDPKAYDAQLALYPEDVIGFIAETQPKAYKKVVDLHGGLEAKAREALLKRLATELDKDRAVQILRRGFKERGVTLRLAQFRPANELEEKTAKDYAANRLRVVRQVRFDPKAGDSVDLVLFVNGVPTATAELKNLWTHQSVQHAISQYRQDRDPKLPLFANRAFVHFAVDSELAYMTTRLAGEQTIFLPFNQGTGGPGQPGGAGNPGDPTGHPTSYLWRQVWDTHRWLELIEKFVHVEAPADPKKGQPTVIFPRYHQWDVVLRSSEHARAHGAGHSYLIQHSAGSGKTKEIAWLAHELSRLHDASDTKVFHKVVVITDRRVLDQQLQRQIAQFEQVRGVVESIDRDSAQLREALTSGEARIIVTTLQKFPIVLRQLNETGESLSGKRYAVIVDEAHSSQTGESAVDLKAVLGSKTVEDLDLDEEQVDGVPTALLAQIAARGHQPNLSFFAFTATPKGKTLELFGMPGPDGNPHAFHTYSMRQAIEEGYILDVLGNYTTYEQLFRLETEAGELEVPKGKARSRIARYAKFHPYAKAQKAAVVVEHYRQHVRPLLGGQAKAMVVTSSREEAVRYKQAIDRVITQREIEGVRSLVAFSGEVTIKDPDAPDIGEKYTEPGMNVVAGQSISEAKLPAEFDKPEYGVLVVAEKYQTGFDQPKLCAMYVDKVLTDVNAVQTLSRLNRTYPGKDTVFVLDFVNEGEQVRKAFEPYYGRTEATPTDPNVLFDAADQAMDFGVIEEEDVAAFTAVYFRPGGREDHAQHSITTQRAYDAARELDKEQRTALKDALNRFIRFYAFLGQVIDYVPPATEQLFLYSKVLLARLLSEAPDGGVSVSVELTHYRLEETGTQILTLGEGDVDPLSAIRGDGTGAGGTGQIPLGVLGELVEDFNTRYGADLSETDLVKPLEHIVQRVVEQEGMVEQARANDLDDFKRGKEGMLIDATLDVQDISGKLLQALLNDEGLRERAFDGVLQAAYEQLRAEPAA